MFHSLIFLLLEEMLANIVSLLFSAIDLIEYISHFN